MKFHRAISFLFHPIIIPIGSALLYFIIVSNFVFIPKEISYRVLGLVFIMTYIIPIALLFFLKRVKLIESFQLVTPNERKFPVLFVAIISFLLGYLFVKHEMVVLLAFSFYGCALALLITYLMLMFKIKVSLHLLGIWGLIAFISIISYSYQKNLLLLIILLILLSGLIATSRLKLKAHSLVEVFLGFFVGAMTQLIVFFYLS